MLERRRGRGTRDVIERQPTWPWARDEGGGSKAADLAVPPLEEGSLAPNGSDGILKGKSVDFNRN